MAKKCYIFSCYEAVVEAKMENGEINDCKCQDMILEDSKEEANDKSTTFLPLG